MLYNGHSHQGYVFSHGRFRYISTQRYGRIKYMRLIPAHLSPMLEIHISDVSLYMISIINL